MANTTPNSDSAGESISGNLERLDEIIAQLEDDDVSLERAQKLHSKGKQLLNELEHELDLGEGEITQRN